MIETTYVTLEQAAKMLSNTSTDTLLTAALEDRVRLWGLLFERRDYWGFVLPLDEEHPGMPDEEGSAFFRFVPLYGSHVAALLKHGTVTTDLLLDEQDIRKFCPGDSVNEITITRDEPLYMLASDVQRIRADGKLPESVPRLPEMELKTRAENTYLNIIGALLGLMLGQTPSGKPQSVYETQQAIIDGVTAHYQKLPGLSERNLETKFSQAKTSLLAYR